MESTSSGKTKTWGRVLFVVGAILLILFIIQAVRWLTGNPNETAVPGNLVLLGTFVFVPFGLLSAGLLVAGGLLWFGKRR